MVESCTAVYKCGLLGGNLQGKMLKSSRQADPAGGDGGCPANAVLILDKTFDHVSRAHMLGTLHALCHKLALKPPSHYMRYDRQGEAHKALQG